VTRDRTSDVGKLVAQLHSAPTAACQACQAERQAVLPVWRCSSRASSAPMPRQVTARLDLTQTAGSTPQNSSKVETVFQQAFLSVCNNGLLHSFIYLRALN